MSTVSGDVRPPGDGNNARLAASELSDSDAASTVGSTKKYGTSADTANEWANTRSYVDQIPVLLLVENGRFIVHASKIKEFVELDRMLESTPSEVGGMQVIWISETAEEVEKTLDILYTPFYSTETVSVEALVCALNLATKYNHPALRAYTIRAIGLRQHELPAIRRIRLSRACSVPEWIPGAVDELRKRRESISLQEANELGPNAFATITRLREQRDRVPTLGSVVANTLDMAKRPLDGVITEIWSFIGPILLFFPVVFILAQLRYPASYIIITYNNLTNVIAVGIWSFLVDLVLVVSTVTCLCVAFTLVSRRY